MALGTIMGLANLVPGLVRLFKGDDAGNIAQEAVDVAKKVTGTDSEDDAVQQIQNDPNLQIEFQKAMAPIVTARLEAETQRLESVNATMRAEYDADNWFVKCWRPFFGYCVAVSWSVLFFGIVHTIVTEPKDAAAVIEAAGSLGVMWGVALSILGINVSKRSDDKAVKLGHKPKPGVFETVAGAVGRLRGKT